MAYIGNTVENQGFTPAIDYFNGNGVTVTFTLSRPIASVAQVIVAVDNVIQNPSSAFNVVGNSITFTSAPLSGTNNIWVEYTSLITTYQGISQDPTVIGDIRATGGYLAEGDFGNSFIDGAILDYVTGAGRVTVGELDDLIFYHGGTAGRSEMMKVSYAGNSTLVGNLAISGSATIQGLTVGKGGGAISTNTAVGSSALSANTTGVYMTAVNQSLRSNTSGNYNVGIGWALNSNTTGSNNVGTGLDCLATNTTGGSNTAYGVQALTSNTTASNNTAVGYQAGYSNTTGVQNTAVGNVALLANTTGVNNTAMGHQALDGNTTGDSNTAVGVNALGAQTTGSSNTAIGVGSGGTITTGTKNTIIGRYDGNQGGLDIRTASNYIVLSDGDGNPRVMVNPNGYVKATNNSSGYISQTGSFHEYLSDISSATTTMIIGNTSASCTSDGILQARAARNTTNNTFYAFSYYNSGAVAYKFRIADSGNATNTNGSYGTISDIKNKENIVDATPKLEKIKELKVRNFNFKGDDLKQIGFIAQEFEQVFPSMIEEHKDTDEEGNDLGTTTKSIKTSVLVPILVKAIQELNAKVEAQALEIATLKAAK